MAALAKAKAFFRRDLRTDLSYKVSFAIEGIDILLGVAAFFFFSGLLAGRRPEGYDPFAFILVGIAVNGAMSTALAAYAQGIAAEQSGGTLKTILATRTSPQRLMLYASLYPVTRASLDAGIYLIGGVVFGLAIATANLAAAATVFALALVAFSSVGVFSAAFTLVLKRGDPVVWLFGALSWVLGGVFFPVDMLPAWLQQLAWWLPITHALSALRAVLLAGADLIEVRGSIAVLAAFAGLGFPLALAAFGLAVRRAKQTGTLDQY